MDCRCRDIRGLLLTKHINGILPVQEMATFKTSFFMCLRQEGIVRPVKKHDVLHQYLSIPSLPKSVFRQCNTLQQGSREGHIWIKEFSQVHKIQTIKLRLRRHGAGAGPSLSCGSTTENCWMLLGKLLMA